MVDVERRRIERARLMNALFDEADGSQFKIVDLGELGARLDITEDETGNAAQYLEGEGLIEAIWTLGSVTPAASLTHRGIKEIEQQRGQPAVPTEHFPAFNVVIAHGNIVNSPIQQASVSSSQTVNYSSDDRNRILELVKELRQVLAAAHFDAEDKDELLAEAATLEAQAGSPRPKHDYIKSSLQRIEQVFEKAAVGAAGAGLLELVRQIPH